MLGAETATQTGVTAIDPSMRLPDYVARKPA